MNGRRGANRRQIRYRTKSLKSGIAESIDFKKCRSGARERTGSVL